MRSGEIKGMPKRKIRSREVFASPWLRLREDEVLHADGTVAPFAVVSRANSVVVVCELADGCIVVTEQYRYAAGRWSLELPQGSVEEGESLAEAALRELREETGWHGVDPQVLARQLYEAADWATQSFGIVRVRAAGRAAACPEKSEWGTRAFAVSPDWLLRYVEASRICDASTLAALYLHRDMGARGATASEGVR